MIFIRKGVHIVWAVHIFGKLPAKLKYSIHIEFKNKTQRTLFTYAAVKSFPARFTGTRSVYVVTYTILTVCGAMLSTIHSIATILACFIVDMDDKLFYQSYKTRIKNVSQILCLHQWLGTNSNDIEDYQRKYVQWFINLLLLQKFPKYPDVQPSKQNPFVELHVPVGKQYKLHWSLQFTPNFPFSQPSICIQTWTVKCGKIILIKISPYISFSVCFCRSWF